VSGIDWKDLRRDWVPEGYKGDKNCAKFFSIGVFDLDKRIGGINIKEDYKENPLYGAKPVREGVDPASIKTSVEQANRILFQNFAKTALKHDTSFPRDKNDWAFGWNEYNSNGYIRGLLGYLGFSAYNPGGTLPGWSKPIPVQLFRTSYNSDAQVKELLNIKDNIFETSVAADPMQLSSTLDP
jgi:hypothetical protein